MGAGLPDRGADASRARWRIPAAQQRSLLGGMFLLAVTVGIVESAMARLRLLRVPQLLVAAGALSVFAFMLVDEVAAMIPLVEIAMMLLILSDMALLGLSRLRTCIAVCRIAGHAAGRVHRSCPYAGPDAAHCSYCRRQALF